MENRHQPTTVHAKTYINDQYKITIYGFQTCGELFDLKNDPGEYDNKWDDPEYADIKAKLLEKFLYAELEKEPTWMPRVWGA